MKDEWFEAIKAGKPEIAYSNFDIASLLTKRSCSATSPSAPARRSNGTGPG